MTCEICSGARMVPNSGEGAALLPYVACPACNPPPPLRGWTWERLRNFFSSGGEIRLPTEEELIEDCRDLLRLSTIERVIDDHGTCGRGGCPYGGDV